MFDDFNKKEKFDIEFQNSKFVIRIKNSEKTFNVF